MTGRDSAWYSPVTAVNFSDTAPGYDIVYSQDDQQPGRTGELGLGDRPHYKPLRAGARRRQSALYIYRQDAVPAPGRANL